MRIYRPKGVTKGQIVLVTILGVFGGVYIWKPFFEELKATQESDKKRNESKDGGA